MTNENRYVLRHEWEKSKGKIHERINQVDNKHVNLHNDLRLLVTELTSSNKMLVDSHGKSQKTLEKINDNLIGFNDRIKDVEYITQDTTKRMDQIEQDSTERQKGNIQIWVAVIGGIVSIIVGALGFAQVFF